MSYCLLNIKISFYWTPQKMKDEGDTYIIQIILQFLKLKKHKKFSLLGNIKTPGGAYIIQIILQFSEPEKHLHL
jgi:hypothetical protein